MRAFPLWSEPILWRGGHFRAAARNCFHLSSATRFLTRERVPGVCESDEKSFEGNVESSLETLILALCQFNMLFLYNYHVTYRVYALSFVTSSQAFPLVQLKNVVDKICSVFGGLLFLNLKKCFLRTKVEVTFLNDTIWFWYRRIVTLTPKLENCLYKRNFNKELWE